ncbi:MAG: hypothetical protein ABIO70_36940 [Pseudomonadota bacterium]
MDEAIDRGALSAFFKALKIRALDVAEPEGQRYYQSLHQPGHDPVERLFDTIDFSGAESIQLIAGFRGTGKSTELSRLAARLRAADYLVVQIDLDHYLDMHGALDPAAFLLLLTGAIGERMTEQGLLGSSVAGRPGFWERAVGFLGREVEITSLGFAGGGAELKVALKDDRQLRARIRDALEGRIQLLVREVRAFHEETLRQLQERWGAEARLVVIVDSLEHLRGRGQGFEEIQESVERLFLDHARDLGLPDTHVVMSVPAFLILQADSLEAELGTGSFQAWSACRVRDMTGEPQPTALRHLRELVERRGDWRLVLPDQPAMDQLILASGGYIRDLLNMMVEAIHLARNGVEPDAADRIEDLTRRAYLPLYADERVLLKRIHDARDVGAVQRKDRGYVMRFLDSHLVMPYLNDKFWYAVHPLVEPVLASTQGEDPQEP